MIEIELTNHINRDLFRKSTRKIALLPYCLREFDHECKRWMGKFHENSVYLEKLEEMIREGES
jgi:hypothetical protein